MSLRFLVTLITLLPLLGTAQPELGYCEQEVEEIAKTQLPRALKAWRTGNYREAERYLKKAVRLDENYADALYLYGDLSVKSMRLPQAEALWLKVLEICPDYKPELNYFLGSILLENGKREKAIELFNAFLTNPERDRGYDKEVKNALNEAKLLEKLLGNPVEFDPEPVQRVSTTEDEYLATISPDQQTIYFTRRSKKVNRRDGPAAKVRLVEEFSAAERQEDGTFEKGAPLPSPFNQNYNEGGPSITADNTELYFTVCEDLNGYKNCDIYYSEKDEYGYWYSPRSVGDHINRRDSWESQASVSANGDALYFASNREGGKGGLDIYRCIRLEDGSWSRPKNLGSAVNTNGDEKTPFIHSDSQTLYFTSNGHQGLGGFDIFYAKANDTVWSKPNNIGYPINSKEDDLGLFVSLDGKTAYFASNKLRTGTGWDLYQFSLPEFARPETVALISGQLSSDDDEGSFDEANLEIKNLKTKEITKIRVDKQTGRYARVVKMNPREDLIVTVKKKGASFSSKYIKAEEMVKNPVVNAPLEVSKLEIGREYRLNDINFPSNSYALNQESKSIIDEFIIFLEDNPGLRADIQGHTDNVGDASSNLILSQNRAKTVYDYVVQNGINPSRLSHHGFGETKPIESNDNEEGRAKNRRTVFVITSR